MSVKEFKENRVVLMMPGGVFIAGRDTVAGAESPVEKQLRSDFSGELSFCVFTQ